MIIAVDFDNTLFETEYPDIIRPKKNVIEGVKYLKSKGCKIILNTCRNANYLEDAVKACEREGLTFDAVNENLQERIDLYGSDTRKIGADFYIDDRTISPSDLTLLLNTIIDQET